MNAVVTAIATGIYTGYFPFAAGTFGTIPAWALAWFWLGNNNVVLSAATLAAFVISVWTSTLAEPQLGHDSKKIVIDEWAGMFISLLFLPHRIDVYVAAFVLFRFYDVVKPFPAGSCESLPKGWGVTMDDVVAGIYANLTCWVGIISLTRLGWLGF